MTLTAACILVSVFQFCMGSHQDDTNRCMYSGVCIPVLHGQSPGWHWPLHVFWCLYSSSAWAVTRMTLTAAILVSVFQSCVGSHKDGRSWFSGGDVTWLDRNSHRSICIPVTHGQSLQRPPVHSPTMYTHSFLLRLLSLSCFKLLLFPCAWAIIWYIFITFPCARTIIW